MNYWLMIKKGVMGLLTGLAAAVVFGIIQAISNYNPIVCNSEITTDCTPQYISSLYYMIIPAVSAFLVGIANWL